MKQIKSVLYLILVIILASCGNTKQLQILQGPIDANRISKVQYAVPVVQEGDILNIFVYSDDAAASALYNQLPVNAVAGAAPQTSGYLVDNNGIIRFNSLGSIEVKGLTLDQVGKLLAERFVKADLLKNPYCLVKYANFKFTIIGEVNRPSVFNSPQEKVSILEALGLAGDLTSYARRDSVMVIREIDLKRSIGWIDLRKSDIFNSEFFYLKQNDVVVVNPTRNKAAINDQILVRNISLGASVLSTIAIVISVLKR